uniref:Uncharacterized protein n=1 Tax=Strigamia maritima TaxID=126957 RepID=T1JE57_STRMM
MLLKPKQHSSRTAEVRNYLRTSIITSTISRVVIIDEMTSISAISPIQTQFGEAKIIKQGWVFKRVGTLMATAGKTLFLTFTSQMV